MKVASDMPFINPDVKQFNKALKTQRKAYGQYMREIEFKQFAPTLSVLAREWSTLSEEHRLNIKFVVSYMRSELLAPNTKVILNRPLLSVHYDARMKKKFEERQALELRDIGHGGGATESKGDSVVCR